MPIITEGEESEHRVTPHVELNNPLSPHPTVVDVGIDPGTRLGTVLNTALLHCLVALQKGDLREKPKIYQKELLHAVDVGVLLTS